MATSGWHRKRLNTPAERARKAEYNSAAYRQTRAKLARTVAAGSGYCWRCGRWIPPGSTWHCGHDDHDRSIIRGIECPPCNLTAAARKGAATRNSAAQHGTDARRTATRAW